MPKRMMLLLLSALIFLAPFAALSGEEPGPVMMGYDDAETYRDWNTNRFFPRLAERTGVNFTYSQYTDRNAWRQAKADMMPGPDLPDILFKAELTPVESAQLFEKGVLVDLKPLIGDNAPHVQAVFEQYPQAEAAVTLPGGEIVSLPFVNEAPSQNCLWINQDWLTALKLGMPANAEELRAVLTAFKERDPNRNGKQDEVPLAFLGAYDLKYLAHAFGLVANDFNMFEQDGEARFMPLEDAFKPFILWCRELYQEGLLDNNGFSTADTLRRVTDAKATQVYGAIFSPIVSSVLPAEWTGSYRVVPPLQYEGRQVYRTIASSVTPGTFAVTTACADPARMLQWVDYFYTEEGAILAMIGQEGIDYLVDGDGTWRKTESASQSSFLSDSVIMTGAMPPGISNDAFQRRFSDPNVRLVSEQIDIVARVAADPFPPVVLNDEQQAYIGPMQAAIGRYVDESIARFVIGEWEATDEQFDAFRDGLKARQVDAFTAFWQEYLDSGKEEQP